jgi:hypothetical protein
VTTATTKTLFTPLHTPLGTVRQPTAEECELVGRDTSYSEPYEARYGTWQELGDYVIESFRKDDHERMKALRDACDAFAIGDDVHIIPAGIYVEE